MASVNTFIMEEMSFISHVRLILITYRNIAILPVMKRWRFLLVDLRPARWNKNNVKVFNFVFQRRHCFF